MKISQNWLSNYIDLSGKTTDQISHALTMIGFEVEGVESTGLAPMDHLVVGEILSFTQHPNADRLSVCQVQVDANAPRTIVCGAKNFKAGDRVIVALPGAVLPGDFQIKKSKLRGVMSEGMMCSLRELGIGEDHSGIAILEDRPAIGTPVNEVFGAGDTVYDLEITPNRPDALSHIGIARELAAWFRLDMRYPEVQANLAAGPGTHLIDSVVSMTPENCPHYRGYSIRGVTIGESPAWLKERLQSIGLRPINNVVDITNFVLHETGQPLHAFDAAKIKGPRIIVRAAHAGEKIITLDEKERTLDSGMTVIADAERALVVAGVMGSIDAEVDATTRDIFLEAAWFNPSNIRRTSRSLALSTDSSYRFERGVDPKGAEFAALRCIDLILELAGGELLGPPLVAGEPPLVDREVLLNTQFVRDRIGFHIDDAEIVAILEALELSVSETATTNGGRDLTVAIPSFRLDLYRPIDLVEEVLRIYGSDRIPQGEVKAPGLISEDNPVTSFVRAASARLVGAGFNEVMHYSLRSEKELRDWYGHVSADTLRLANPLASDASHLRTSVLPGLLDCVALNQARHNQPRRLFEVGRVFRENGGRLHEMVSVGFVLLHPESGEWLQRQKPDYYTVARITQDILGAAGIRFAPDRFEPIAHENPWQEGHAAKLGAFAMGFEAKFGLLNLAMTRDWDITGPVYAGVVYLTPELLHRPRKRARYQPFSAFPPSHRDLAVVVPLATPAGKVRAEVEKIASAATGKEFNLESVRIFDVYTGTGVPEGHKSIALNLVFRSDARTLQDAEVAAAFEAIRAAVSKHPGLQVRG